MTEHPSETQAATIFGPRSSGLARVVIGGLDGTTPLGFLAALGVLRVLSDRGAETGAPAALISWRQLDAWRPVLYGATFDQIIDAVSEDVSAWEEQPVLGFRYLKLEKKGPKPFGGLRAPVAVLRAWLLARRRANDETSLAYAAALMCETANERIKHPATREQLDEHGVDADCAMPLDRGTLPTFFDFTSRNAQFLDQLCVIRGELDRATIASELETGRPSPAAPRSMDWDPMADTPGAIYTGYTRGFLPASEWLAFRGLVHSRSPARVQDCKPLRARGGERPVTLFGPSGNALRVPTPYAPSSGTPISTSSALPSGGLSELPPCCELAWSRRRMATRECSRLLSQSSLRLRLPAPALGPVRRRGAKPAPFMKVRSERRGCPEIQGVATESNAGVLRHRPSGQRRFA